MGTYATIGEITKRIPKDNLDRMTIPYDKSYVPTYGEIVTLFPICKDGGDRPMLSLDGVLVRGEYGDGDFVPSGMVDWVSTGIGGIKCWVPDLHGEVPISGGTYPVRASVTFVRKVNGVEDGETTSEVKPYIKVLGRDGVTVDGDNVTVPANLTTSKAHADIECQYGFKGVLLKKRMCLEQSENGFNEWELSDDESVTLELSVDNPDFGMDGGVTKYHVYRRYVETMVRRDWIGNIVDRKQTGEKLDDVTAYASIYNPYDRKFIIGDGEIICAKQKPNGIPVACTIVARYGGLEDKCRLTQDAGVPTTNDTVLEFADNSGKKLSRGVTNSTKSLSVAVRSVDIEMVNGEVADERVNTLLSAHSRERWVAPYISVGEDGNVVLDIDILSANEDKNGPRKAVVVVSRRKGDAEPIFLELEQAAASLDGKMYCIECFYPKTVYMEICGGEKVRVECYELKAFDDGTKIKTTVDDGKVSLKLSVENDGGMVTVSEPVGVGDGVYESTLGFVSENMNDFTDFRYSLYDKEGGELLQKGRLESIKCVEVPVRVVEKKPVHETSIGIGRDKKIQNVKTSTPRFVVGRDKDGKMRFRRC